MGLFSRGKISEVDHIKLVSGAEYVHNLYDGIYHRTDDVEALVKQREFLNEELNKLICLQNKYPLSFRKNTPKEAAQKIKDELPNAERLFVERYIISIEKKLLNYKTPRGKMNNLINMVDKFKYYSGEFLPETVDYFKQLVKQHFNYEI